MSLGTADRDLEHLYPPFAERIKAILAQATAECRGKWGIDHWIINEGFRCQARQNWLYSEGRSRPGDIVTETTHSFHTSGMAADCVPVDKEGNILWNACDAAWAQYGHAVRTQGLRWGGDFPKFTHKSFVDQPHAEAPPDVRADWGPKANAYLRAKGLV